jgi:hypothetical protein
MTNETRLEWDSYTKRNAQWIQRQDVVVVFVVRIVICDLGWFSLKYNLC